MDKTIVIGSNSDKSPLELNLDNLKLRLRIQEENVKRTKQEIVNLEELLEKEKSL